MKSKIPEHVKFPVDPTRHYTVFIRAVNSVPALYFTSDIYLERGLRNNYLSFENKEEITQVVQGGINPSTPARFEKDQNRCAVPTVLPEQSLWTN